MKLKHLLCIVAIFWLTYDVLDTRYEACKGVQPVVVTTEPYVTQTVLCAVSTVKSVKESYKSKEVAEAIAQKVKSMGGQNVVVKKQ